MYSYTCVLVKIRTGEFYRDSNRRLDFESDKTRTASVLTGLKCSLCCELTGKVIFKKTMKIKAKDYVNQRKSLAN